MGRALPSMRSSAALLCILIGAIVYVLSDDEFRDKGVSGQGYVWACIYYVFIVFNMVYGKVILRDVEFKNPVTSSTYYTNFLSIPFMLAFGFLKNEPANFSEGLSEMSV